MATARTRKPTGTAPASRVDVRLEVPVADCSIVNAQGSRVVESGAFELLVGQRSRDRISCGEMFAVDWRPGALRSRMLGRPSRGL